MNVTSFLGPFFGWLHRRFAGRTVLTQPDVGLHGTAHMNSSLVEVDTVGTVDSLGRTKFSQHLLDLVQSVQAGGGTVVGLEGEWGSGKTWVLRQTEMLCDELAQEYRPIFVRFNPWMVSGTSEIVEAFLIQLASELAEKSHPIAGFKSGAQIASKLIDYTRVLSTVKHLSPLANILLPGTGLLFEAVGTAAEEAAAKTQDALSPTLDRWKKSPETLSLTAARRQVVELLKKSERRIIVAVDDLDRLPPSDLGSMIQAVKAVADFPNLVYLLAYDPKTTAGALETALGLHKGEGNKYLEKIVQLPLHVPEIPPFRMQAFAKARFCEVLRPLVAAVSDSADLDEAVPRAAALMETPRDVIRLCSRLNVIAPQLAREINLADLLLVEAIGLKEPAIIEYVDQHRPAMLSVSIERYDEDLSHRGHLGDPLEQAGINDDEQDEHNRKLRRGWHDVLGEHSRLKVQTSRAMAFLFDHAREDAWVTEVTASRLRMQRLKNWNRWRSAFADVEFFENSEVLAWLANPAALKGSRVLEDPTLFNEFCALASDLCDEAPTVNALGFTELFLEASRSLGEDTLLRWQPVYAPQAAVDAVLRKEANHEIRRQAIALLLDDASVWLSYRLVSIAHGDAIGFNQHPPADPGDRLIEDEATVRQLDRLWVEAALAELNRIDTPDPMRPAFTLASRILALGGDTEYVRDAVTRIARDRQRGLDILFSGEKYCDEQIRTFGWDGPQELVSVVDLLEALPRSPDFEKDHIRLVELWRRQATELSAKVK